ncbi:MAG: Hsp33 family molecular chaperone HslO [Gammaproteobacteria bacterium HGW-Gammaproteobacteria-3]|nr:MAG: Hsp33 family molecular chaperone HslO [Gammaproteobacteria bacterium HGW-Gammaproteobacteria-3]
MKEQDKLRRFLFEDLGIRGVWVSLDQSWQAVKRHQYGSEPMQEQLGQALAAVAMLSSTLKSKGAIILQTQGNGALETLVASATEQRKIRGLVRARNDMSSASLPDLFGEGYLALTIKSENAEPYQGIVPLQGQSIGQALETYFNQSEQIDTHIRLCAHAGNAAGLLVQALPDKHSDKEDWQRISLLADTLTDKELFTLDCETLLYRLFNQDQVRLFDTEPVAFECACSTIKIEATLESLGRPELDSVIAEQGEINVDCEFCGRHYRFDQADVARLFATHPDVSVPDTRH